MILHSWASIVVDKLIRHANVASIFLEEYCPVEDRVNFDEEGDRKFETNEKNTDYG